MAQDTILTYKLKSFFKLDKFKWPYAFNLNKENLQKATAPDSLIYGVGVTKITASSIEPADPQPGDVWIDLS